MSSDETVLVTKETLDDAIRKTAAFLEMRVPKEPHLFWPDDVARMGVGDVGTDRFVNFKEGYVCLPEQTTSEALYHEAAHWVLFGNGHNYAPQDKFFYGKLFDEIFATLAQMWMTRTSRPVIKTKQELSTQLDVERECMKAYTAKITAYQSAIANNREGLADLRSHLIQAESAAAKCGTTIDALEFAYWHLCLEQSWQGALAGQRDIIEFHKELGALHRTLHEKHAHVYSSVVDLLASRGALAYYAYANKPQAIIRGWFAMTRGIDMPFVHTYLSLIHI